MCCSAAYVCVGVSVCGHMSVCERVVYEHGVLCVRVCVYVSDSMSMGVVCVCGSMDVLYEHTCGGCVCVWYRDMGCTCVCV